MKKLLLCSTLIIALFLVGCNNNTNNNNVNINNNNSNNVSNSSQTQEDNKNNTDVVTYDSTDFSKSAGFKLNLEGPLENVAQDSIFLINNSIVQLDLIFPDKLKGTLLLDSNASSYLYNANDEILVDDIKVSIQNGADGIISYEWQKNGYSFVFSTKNDIKESQILKDLVLNANIEETK